MTPDRSSPPNAPRIGVVAVWHADPPSLQARLAEIVNVDGCRDIEVIVVAPAATTSGVVAPKLPKLRFVEPPPGHSPTLLRRLGLEAAAADIILFTDEREQDFAVRLTHLVQDLGTGMSESAIRVRQIGTDRSRARAADGIVSRSAAEPPFDL